MRFICKTALPPNLSVTLEKALQLGLSWAEFGDRYRTEKADLRTFLEKEQNGLCAYSELSLREYDYHLEHIRPKGKAEYFHLRFEYTNLVASSPKNSSNLEKRRDLFGGHKKGEEYDEALFISPTEPECGRYFQYSPDGDIDPKSGLSELERSRAIETIECLGLQSSGLLRNKRRNIYNAIQAQLSYFLDQPDALEEMLNSYFEPDSDGNLKPFQSVVRQIAGK